MKTHKKIFTWYLFLIIFFIGSANHQIGKAEEIESPIRVGVFEMNGFFEKESDGTVTGYCVDYLKRLAQYTGWTYEYIWADSWDECVRLLRENKVDLIAPAQEEFSRLQEFGFSSFNIGMEAGALLTLSTNDHLIYEDYEAFQSLKIGYVNTLIFKDDFDAYAKTNHFTPNYVVYKNTKALIAALNAGEIDAVLINFFAKTETTKVLAKFGISPIYFMFSKDNFYLQQELDNALKQLKTEEIDFETHLMKQYYPTFNYVPFTKAELEYISSAPVLKIGCRSNIKPLSYVDKATGEVSGITRDILDEISRISGFSFEYIALPEGDIDYEYLRKNHISLISCVEYNSENLSTDSLKLSNPYIDSNKVFICKKELYFNTESPLRLAVCTGSQTLAQVIHDAYPNFQIDNYKTLIECFEAVRTGKADALLQNQYVVTSYLAKPIYSDLITVPVESLDDKMCLSPVIYQQKGVADSFLSDPRLLSILNKAINQLDQQTITKIIIKRTTEHQYSLTIGDFLYQYRYPLAAALFILFLLAAVGIYAFHTKKHSYRMIRQSEAKLRNITNNINGGVVVLTRKDELRITYANEGFLKLLRCEKEDYDQVHNQNYVTYIHPDDVKVLEPAYQMDIQSQNKISVKLRIMRKDGNYIPVLFNGTLTENLNNEPEIYCVIMDISEQERMAEQISLEQEKYRILVENSGDIIFQIDCIKQETILSPLYREKFGWKLSNNPCQGGLAELPALLKVHQEELPAVEQLIREIFGHQAATEVLARLMKRDRTFLWCRIALYPMQDKDEKFTYVIGKLIDVDKEVRTREELEQKSKIDALTDLLNKTSFFEMAKEYLSSSNGKNTVLVFIDIDNFKQVNDVLGHMAGDQAIKETAKKLRVIYSAYDIISRFGGDEFCILLKEISEETLRDKLAWTVEKLRTVYSANGEEVRCSASIGAACTYGRKQELDELIEKADQALYEAKDNGKDQYVIYSDKL